MIKFAYNNIKNRNISYVFFEFNYAYYFYIFYKKDFNLYFQFKITNKLASKLKNLMILSQKTSIICKTF